VLEKVALSFVVAFAVILLVFLIHGKWPGLTRQIDVLVVSASRFPTMSVRFDMADCGKWFSGMRCA
jgi:hypothetical protein